ncbi:MAG TPA: DPP IV N-terminal domain-containing protein [Bryobacteraceae bacterium]
MREAAVLFIRSACLLGLAAILAQAAQQLALTLDTIAASAEFAGTPSAVWSPDGRYLARPLARTSFGKGIEVLDAHTGQLRLRFSSGALHIAGWTANRNGLICADEHSIVQVDLPSGRKRRLLVSATQIRDVDPAPNGKWIGFTRSNTLFLLDTASGRLVQSLTPNGSERLRMGVPDPMLAREFHQDTAYWWSPDSSAIAWLETSEPDLASGHSESRSGDPIPMVTVFVTDLATQATRRIDTGPENNRYLPRVQWLPDSRRLAIQRLNREQTTVELLIAQASTGASNVVLKETDPYWINIHDDLTFLDNGDRFLWSSERSGYRHVYLYRLDGSCPPLQLTSGSWEVTHLLYVDQPRQLAYFSSTQASPTERQLYRVGLDGTVPARLTQAAGTHADIFSPDGRFFLDTVSTAISATCQSISPTDNPQQAIRLDCSRAAPITPGTLSRVEFFHLKAQDGTSIDAMMIKPPDFDPHRRYPVIVYNDAGPGEQAVVNGWTGWISLWHQFMAARGFIVFAADNRGAAGHGHVSEEPLHYRLGAQETSDIRDAVHYLRDLPYVDAGRVGIWGTHYGGFLALHALFKDPTDFRCAAAVSPLTDLHETSAVFAERYLGLLAFHRNEFEQSAPFEAAGRMRGRLLLASAPGTTVTLQRSLQAAGKTFETVVLSKDSEATPVQADLAALLPRLTDFFLAMDNVGQAATPAGKSQAPSGSH